MSSAPPPRSTPRQALSASEVGLYVAHTGTAKGRGVYAARAYAAGEVVELAPVILFDGKFNAIPSEVRELLFNWSALAGVPVAHGLALGYGSLYNHDNPANLRYEADAASRVLRFIAARDVAVGEELTINYNDARGVHTEEGDTWFAKHGIEAITNADGA
jgi:hypothetical protein